MRSLRTFFGNERTEELAGLIAKGDLEPVVRTLLQKYYDPRYRHAMRNYRYLLEVSSENLDQAAATLEKFWRRTSFNAPAASAS